MFHVLFYVLVHSNLTHLPACVRRCPARASLRRQAQLQTGHLKGFSPECNFMCRNKFPFWVKEAPHWLHWNGLSPKNTWMIRWIRLNNYLHLLQILFPFVCFFMSTVLLVCSHLCGYVCAPSAHLVQCRSSRTPHTGASRWAGGQVLVKQHLDWPSHCKYSLCLHQSQRNLCSLLPWSPLCHPSCYCLLQPLCSLAVEPLVTHHHCTAQP